MSIAREYNPVTDTVVVNTSGERRYFDFLPPFGAVLDDQQEFYYPGDITEWMRRKGPGSAREKLVRALDHAVKEGLLEVKNTPQVVLFDDATGQTKTFNPDGSLKDPTPGGPALPTTTTTSTTTAASTTTP